MLSDPSQNFIIKSIKNQGHFKKWINSKGKLTKNLILRYDVVKTRNEKSICRGSIKFRKRITNIIGRESLLLIIKILTGN